jgi:hypothetical protein
MGLANVGSIASDFGISIEDQIAILAVFSENGIKGAEAGTVLKSMLLKMADDTDTTAGAWDALNTSLYTADGTLRPFSEVLADVETGLAGMNDQTRNNTIADLAGSYGILGLNALTGAMSIDGMRDSMANQQSAAEIAAARMEAFEIVMGSLGGSVDSLNIATFTPFMNDVLKPLAEQLILLINGVTAWAEANPELTTSILTVTAAVAGIGIGMTALGTVMTLGGTIIAGFGAGLTALTMGFATFAIPVTGAFLVLSTLFGAINNVYPGGAMQMFSDLGTTAAFFGTQIATALTPYITSVTDQVTGLTSALETAKTTLEGLVSGLNAYNTTASQVATINTAVTSGQVSQADLNQITLNAIGSQFSSMFGGGRAEGGNVSAGTPYLVGERGPELFMPRSNGSIMPNQQAGGGNTFNISISVAGDADGRKIGNELERELRLIMQGRG